MLWVNVCAYAEVKVEVKLQVISVKVNLELQIFLHFYSDSSPSHMIWHLSSICGKKGQSGFLVGNTHTLACSKH